MDVFSAFNVCIQNDPNRMKDFCVATVSWESKQGCSGPSHIKAGLPTSSPEHPEHAHLGMLTSSSVINHDIKNHDMAYIQVGFLFFLKIVT